MRETVLLKEKVLQPLEKLLSLQGFVTTDQLCEAVPESEKREAVSKALAARGVQVIEQNWDGRALQTNKRYGRQGDIDRYTDPAWVYLSRLGRLPLMTRGQEVQQAVLIHFAQYQMLTIAFREKRAMEALFRLAGRIRAGKMKYREVLATDGAFLSSENNERKTLKEFLRTVDRIKKQSSSAGNGPIKRAMKKDSKKKGRRHVLPEEECAGLCMQLRLSPGLMRDLINRSRAGQEGSSETEKRRALSYWEEVESNAKCALIEANVRLVVSVAKRYLRRGMDISDIIQEGNRGLIIAVDNYDYRKGYRFSTYAVWWIRQAVLRAIHEKSKTIHMPANAFDFFLRIERFRRAFGLMRGRQPSVEEMAARFKCSRKKISAILECAARPLSLDMQAGSDDATVGEHMEDTHTENPFERLSLADLRSHIQHVLDTLEPKEKQTVVMRFGLDDGRIKTLGEIAEQMRLSNERIRQIEIKALKKLRMMSRVGELAPWRDGAGIEIEEYSE